MEQNNYRVVNNCRLCSSTKLKPCFDFGEVPLGNNLSNSNEIALNADKYPLFVNRCCECNHFQLGVAVDPDKLYATNYTYLSGVGPSFIKHFKEYAIWASDKCNLHTKSLIVDIGSNDGTCLKEFKKLGYRVCGVDPASAPAELANNQGIKTLNTFFDEKAVKDIITICGKADFITSHNVLAHVDDLRAVFKNIYDLLKDDGYFCFEIGYFKEVMINSCFDTIYHEHLDYHHAAPLSRFLCEIGFDLVDLSVNSVQGGSLRLFLKKTGEGRILSKARAFLDEENKSILYQDNIINYWQSQIKANMSNFRKRVKTHANAGRTVMGYGAPTKATLLTEVSDLNSDDISFIVEDNSLKVNKFMPGSGVPILDAKELRSRKPEVIVIFAWNFADDIIAKLKELVDWPVSVIVPLPELYEVKL